MPPRPNPGTPPSNPPTLVHLHGQNRQSHPSPHSNPPHRTDPSVDPGSQDTTAYYTFTTSNTFYYTPTRSTPPTIPHAGITAGEIIGHRLWWVLYDLRLCSLAHIHIWKPDEVIIGNVDELVDDQFLVCQPIYGGVYCYTTRQAAEAELNKIDLSGLPISAELCPLNNCTIAIHGLATGTIKLWGEVIEHEHGYRASHARLLSIDDVIGPVDLSALQQRYLPK